MRGEKQDRRSVLILVTDLLSGDNLSLQSIDLGSCDFWTASGDSLAVCHFHPFGGVRCLSTSRKQWICSAFRSTPSGRSVVVAPMVLKSFLRADLRALDRKSTLLNSSQ